MGTYAITAALGTLAAQNYTFTFASGTLSVTAATLTVTANDASRGQGQADPAYTASYSGFVLGQTIGDSGVTGSPSLTSNDTTASPPGTYTITAAQGSLSAENYTFSFVNGTLTVTGPSVPRITPTSVTSATTLSGPLVADLGGVGAGNSTEYLLTGSTTTLDLGSVDLSLDYVNGYVPAVGDRITLVQNNTGNANAVTGVFDDASGVPLQNGAEVYATDTNGNVIDDAAGNPVYFRIFYPGGGVGPDGTTTSNQNVYLVRQAPVTIVGSSQPESSGLVDPTTGLPVQGIQYDAGDPTLYGPTNYQYVDASGTPGTPVVTSTVGPSGVAYDPIVPVSVTTATTLSTEFDAQLQGIGPYNASEYAVSGGGALNLNNEALTLSYIDGYVPAVGDRITLVQNTTGNANAVTRRTSTMLPASS